MQRRRLTRALIAFAVSLATLTTTAAINSGTAGATTTCSGKTHCYGIAEGTGKGGYVSYYPSCLSAPAKSFATQEMWVGNFSSRVWVEAGLIYLNSIALPGQRRASTGRFAFTGNEQAKSYAYHLIENSVPVQQFDVELYLSSTSTYTMLMNTRGGSTHHSLTLKNPMSSTNVYFGTEGTANTVHSAIQARYIQTEVNGPSDFRSGVNVPYGAYDPPNTFAWTTKYSAFSAGVPC